MALGLMLHPQWVPYREGWQCEDIGMPLSMGERKLRTHYTGIQMGVGFHWSLPHRAGLLGGGCHDMSFQGLLAGKQEKDLLVGFGIGGSLRLPALNSQPP